MTKVTSGLGKVIKIERRITLNYLFIAEKPSLMRSVQSCYNNHKKEIEKEVGKIDFVALSGHVCGYYEPNDYPKWNCRWQDIDYPMIPDVWKVKPTGDSRKAQIIKKIQESANLYDGIIVGTDSDTEGYGIYYHLEHYLGLENKKTLRFVEHSLTDSEILQSLLSMTDYHTDPVHVRFTQSFLLRSRADWLYGMNATRMMSSKMNSLMTIGRVKSPTIKLVYDNSLAIENFVQRKYYVIQAEYDGFTAPLVGSDFKPLQFDTLALAEQKKSEIPLEGIVEKKQEKEVKTHAPKLYDLSSIQTEAGRIYGYTPEETLMYIQSLYETHKVISYPRTQCRYVSTEKAKEFVHMLRKVAVFDDLKPYLEKISNADIARVLHDKQVVNDKEVEKESHDALLPTDTTPVLGKLNAGEINICKMIYIRLLAQFLPILTEQKTTLVLNHGGNRFIVHGKSVTEQGWRVLYRESKDVNIPYLSEGQSISAKQFRCAEKMTTPPKRLTQPELLNAMVNIANQVEDEVLRKSLSNSKGIGTPATRAAIIKDIIARGYVEDRKGLYITSKGKSYIENMRGLEIISPVFAALMDYDIKKIQRGEIGYDEAYAQTINKLNSVCHQIDSMKVKSVKPKYKCLKCGSGLIDSKWEYKCPSCDFKLSKFICGKQIDESVLDMLYAGKPTPKFVFRKKDGSEFKARLKFAESGLAFDFTSGLTCPFCGGGVKENRAGCFCNCGLKLFNPLSGKTLTENQIRTLLEKKKLPIMKGFVGRSGNKFDAGLELTDAKTVKFVFKRS